MDHAEQLAGLPDGDAADGNSPGFSRMKMHVNPPGNVLLPNLHPEVGFLLTEPDHLPVFAAPVGTGCGADIQRLQNIGLSLGIIAEEHIDPPVERQVKLLVISEILQIQRLNIHPNPAFPTG